MRHVLTREHSHRPWQMPARPWGVRPRWLPAATWYSEFPELNVRTYVRVGDTAGVYFFSLDASSPAAVWAARRWTGLPYFRADTQIDHDGLRSHADERSADLIPKRASTETIPPRDP